MVNTLNRNILPGVGAPAPKPELDRTPNSLSARITRIHEPGVTRTQNGTPIPGVSVFVLGE